MSHAEVSTHFSGVALELSRNTEFKSKKIAPSIYSFSQSDGLR